MNQSTNQNWALRFIPLWLGQALSLLGSQLVQFAIIWYLTRETNSATTLAIASMMGLLPQVLLSPFIGTWVDRGNRRLILIAADAIVAIATLVLAILFAAGSIQVWQIYIVLFIRAVASGFHQSAFGASVVLLVPKEHLARVQGFNQALYGGLNILSAPLGAYLLAVLPMQGILGIDVGTALLAITILLFIPIPQPERSAQTPSEGTPSIVLEIDAQGAYSINESPVPGAQLAARLHQIYDARPDKVLFVKGDGKAKYSQVVEAMDVARGAGVRVLGMP